MHCFVLSKFLSSNLKLNRVRTKHAIQFRNSGLIYSFPQNLYRRSWYSKPLERGKSGKAQIRSHAEAPAFEWLRGGINPGLINPPIMVDPLQRRMKFARLFYTSRPHRRIQD